ncbi:MAG: phosphatase PAP2 family protein [Pirellulales bacterium]
MARPRRSTRFGMYIETLECRSLMASDWQNPVLIRDVDQSGRVTARDVLLIINRINTNLDAALPATNEQSNEPLVDVNGDNLCSPLDALLVIDAINSLGGIDPSIVSGLAAPSDPNSDGVVLVDQIQIEGQALPGSRIEASCNDLQNTSRTTFADSQGRYHFELPIGIGEYKVHLQATDELGRSTFAELKVQRGNVIQDFDAAALNVVRQWTTLSNDPYTNRVVMSQPPLVARNLAMIHTAMFDAANAIEGRYAGYVFQDSPQPDASEVAAAAMAGYEVAKTLYHEPDELGAWQSSLEEALATVVDSTARDLGIAIGKRAAQAMLTARAADGATSKPTYQPVDEIGHWKRTFPDYLPPLLAQWPHVKPFALTEADEFRPAPPPALDSAEYATAVDQVMRLGGYQSTDRTDEQTAIALFWADGGGTATPPGHWNRITSDVTLARNSNLIETARAFALVDLAMADAGIAAWEAKYYYDLWRPIDAIRKAETDGNEGTQADSNWIPLLKTPPFPTYTSGHSTFSGAASAVLAFLFGDETPFDSTSDGQDGPEQRPLSPDKLTTRHFNSFSSAAEEAGISRIYGGIHFSFDNSAGLQLGRQIGAAVVARVGR